MTHPETQNPTQIVQTDRPNIPSIYAEGLSQMMLGFPNSRLLMHSSAVQNSTSSATVETRQLTCELVMPTTAMIEMARAILDILSQNQKQFEIAKAEWLGKLDAISQSIQNADVPATPNVTH
jgi:hypothetical protein